MNSGLSGNAADLTKDTKILFTSDIHCGIDQE